MKSLFYSLIFLVVAFGCRSVLGNQLTSPSPSCVCNLKEKDLLEEPQKFEFGEYSGLCIDSCRFRRARILSTNNGSLRVGNILNEGSSYTATISRDNFETVEMGFEKFLPGINHVFLKFQVAVNSPPILLYDQRSPSKAPIKTRSLVLSSEAVPPVGHKYNIFKSYFGNYLMVTRLTTGEEMERWIKALKHPTTLLTLALSKEKASKIFFDGVQDSDNNGLKTIYKLFTNNCSTKALGFIDKEIDYRKTTGIFNLEGFEEALPISGPIGTARALRLRRLVGYP